MHEKLSTSDELHDEENLEVGLEHKLHANEEWMIRLLQYVLLEHGRLNLIII